MSGYSFPAAPVMNVFFPLSPCGNPSAPRRGSDQAMAATISSFSSYGYNEIMLENFQGVSTRLCLSDPWAIKKLLMLSDARDTDKLSLPTNLVKYHLFNCLGGGFLEKVENKGVRVTVYDSDTKSDHQVLLKQWIPVEGYVFARNWKKEFAKRRHLNFGDEIGLYWDKEKSKFIFSVLRRASQ